MNKVINLYRTFYPSRENERDEDAVRSFVEKANQSGDSAFDSDVVSQYIENPLFVERKIIDSILDLENIHLDVEYLSVYSKQMNAAGASSEDDKAIVVDELWSYTALSFFLTVLSLAYDSGKENFTRCIKNCFVLLDLQGRKHEIGVHSLNDIEQMISLVTKAVGRDLLRAYPDVDYLDKTILTFMLDDIYEDSQVPFI